MSRLNSYTTSRSWNLVCISYFLIINRILNISYILFINIKGGVDKNNSAYTVKIIRTI
ncbi:MAG: hypothetical protein BWY18_00139 [Candidatus Cloacimonetes bacterium ADurb.Bin211]|jgi:hypothetical protein|nr:MAG: hypothetical protein BWY18_00139 [Candidatus Cloacimonetes bacterium ADurb.Bin211]